MVWKIEFDKKAVKEFKNLDKSIQKQIDKFLMKLVQANDFRKLGKALKGKLHTFWRYRVGDYRLICKIEDNIFIILIITIKHRREVYK